jgi:hypothetical protein
LPAGRLLLRGGKSRHLSILSTRPIERHKSLAECNKFLLVRKSIEMAFARRVVMIACVFRGILEI